MTRSRKRVLLLTSFIWVLLIGAVAYLTYPSIGPVAASIEPNPFCSVDATGIASAPFHVGLKTASWLGWTLVPVALLWALALLLGRRSSGRAA